MKICRFDFEKALMASRTDNPQKLQKSCWTYLQDIGFVQKQGFIE